MEFNLLRTVQIVQIHQDTSLHNCRAPEAKLPILSDSQILNREFDDFEFMKQHLMYCKKVKNEMGHHQRKIYPNFKSTWSTRKELFRKTHDLAYACHKESMLGDKHIKTIYWGLVTDPISC
jgi:hypothetical protein